MKRICITGCGFIGHHLANKLKAEGHFIRIVDMVEPSYPTKYDEFIKADLRDYKQAKEALSLKAKYKYNVPFFDEVYQLAADFGGMDYISRHETDCLTNNVLINLNCIKAAVENKVKRYFFSSSVCIYPDLEHGVKTVSEEEAYPAHPDNEYGWEKLYTERLVAAYGREFPIEVRIARFENCYGEESQYEGGREKAPAALSRKVVRAEDPGAIEVYGDGSAVRGYIYVKDLIEGIVLLMRSDLKGPTNICPDEHTSVDELSKKIIKLSSKNLKINYIDGPVGVKNRNFSNKKIKSVGWKPKYTLDDGLKRLYPWILSQVSK